MHLPQPAPPTLTADHEPHPACRVWISVRHGYAVGTCGHTGDPVRVRFDVQDGRPVFRGPHPACLTASVCKRIR